MFSTCRHPLVALLLSSWLALALAKLPCEPNPYPVFYNVQGKGNLSADAVNFGLIKGARTYTGGMGGVWPRLVGSKVINGGVPQAANFSLHAEALKATIARRIPKGFTGNCAFDFEDWTNVWSLNDGSGSWHSRVYQTYSKKLVQEAHPSWSADRVEKEAQAQWNAAATKWMVDTLEVAKQVRPKARWGYYGFPQNWVDCVGDVCGYNLPIIGNIYRNYSDMQQAIYDASTAIYPSVYVFKGLSASQLPSYIGGTVKEGLRVAPADVPVLPFQMSQYHNLALGLLPANLLVPAIQQPHMANASGLILWGYIPAPNATYHTYVDKVLGPTVWNFLEQLCHKKPL